MLKISQIAKNLAPHKEVFESASTLSGIDASLAKVLVNSGLEDGSKSDDKIKVSKKSWSAASLKPSQTSMVLDKALGMALFMLKTNKIGGDLGAIVSKDNYIMDGHHRWAATILASGKRGKVGGLGAGLKGKDLLRVLNLLTVGAFHIRNGNPGKGALNEFTESNVSKALSQMVNRGMGGPFPWSPEDVQEVLEKNFGSVEEGVSQISKNAKYITKSTPAWAPSRSQMPVIDPKNLPEAARKMDKGVVDWNDPYSA